MIRTAQTSNIWTALERISTSSATLIYCGSRDDFLSQLSSTAPLPYSSLSPPIPLQLITKLQQTPLAFIPSLFHLRAFLLTLEPPTASGPESQDVVVFGVVAMLQASGETIGGVLNNFAALVEAADTLKGKVVLFENDEDWQHRIVPLVQGTEQGMELWKIISRWGFEGEAI